MKMKTLAGIIAAALLVLLVGACGGKNDTTSSEEVSQLFRDLNTSGEKFILAIEKAGSVSDLVGATNDFCDKVEELVPKVKEISQKSPNIFGHDSTVKMRLESLTTTINLMAPKINKKMALIAASSTSDEREAFLKAVQRLSEITQSFSSNGN